MDRPMWLEVTMWCGQWVMIFSTSSPSLGSDRWTDWFIMLTRFLPFLNLTSSLPPIPHIQLYFHRMAVWTQCTPHHLFMLMPRMLPRTSLGLSRHMTFSREWFKNSQHSSVNLVEIYFLNPRIHCRYADRDSAYWTGYFTSRPAFKRYVRSLSGYYLVSNSLSGFSLSNSDTNIENVFYFIFSLSKTGCKATWVSGGKEIWRSKHFQTWGCFSNSAAPWWCHWNCQAACDKWLCQKTSTWCFWGNKTLLFKTLC